MKNIKLGQIYKKINKNGHIYSIKISKITDSHIGGIITKCIYEGSTGYYRQIMSSYFTEKSFELEQNIKGINCCMCNTFYNDAKNNCLVRFLCWKCKIIYDF